VSVLELKEGEFTFTDSDGKSRLGRRKLVAATTVRGGKVFQPTCP
jgi:predicted amidohydrolase